MMDLSIFFWLERASTFSNGSNSSLAQPKPKLWVLLCKSVRKRLDALHYIHFPCSIGDDVFKDTMLVAAATSDSSTEG